MLPKNCIHRMVPGEKIDTMMTAWNEAIRATVAHKEWGLRQWFAASAHALAAQSYPLELRRTFLRRGYLLWKDSPGALTYGL